MIRIQNGFITIKPGTAIRSMCLFFASFLLVSNGFSQSEYNYEAISIKDGLSNNIIMDVYQDRHGFLWLATQDGLNKYDGYTIETFKNIPGDTTSLPHNWVACAYEDSRGQLWIGTQAGLAKFDPERKIFKNYRYSQSNAQDANIVWDIFEDDRGNMWLGTSDGMRQFDPETGQFQRFDVMETDNTVKRFVNESFAWTITEDGTLYAGANSFGLLRYDYDANIFIQVNLKDKFNKNKLTLARHWALFAEGKNKIWLATTDGLFVVDIEQMTGREISLFKKADRINDFQINTVTGFFKDRNKKLWISTFHNGMFLFDPLTETHKNFRPYHTNAVYWRMYQDKYGILWIPSNRGLIKYEFDREPFGLYTINESTDESGGREVLDFTASSLSDKKIWMGTSDGLYEFDSGSKSFRSRNDILQKNAPDAVPNIQSVHESGDKTLWFGTLNSGLHAVNLSTKNSRQYTFQLYDPTTLNSNRIYDLAEDTLGNIWIGTSNGINLYNKNENRIETIPTHETRRYDPAVSRILDSLQTSTTPVSAVTGVGDYADRSVEFALTRDEDILISSMGEGLPQWGMVDYGWLESMEGDTLWTMADYFETFHASGSSKNRILTDVLNLERGRYRLRYKSDDSHSVESYNDTPPQDSLMWGIRLFRISKSQSDRLKAVISENQDADYVYGNITRSIYPASDGTVWLAMDAGLSRVDLRDQSIRNYLHDPIIPGSISDNGIADVKEDSLGNIWVATSNGLNKYSPENETFVAYGEKDGLPTANLRALEFDNAGNLWISSIKGISRLDLNSESEKPLFVNYDVKDGLQGYSFFSGGSLKDDHGYLYFTGANGFNVFKPGTINNIPPDLAITDLSITNKSILEDREKTYLNGSFSNLAELSLPYTKNDLSFSFAAIHYSRPDNNRLLYQLEGIDEEWLDGERKFASYINLDPGEYVFRVKGSNGDGIWNDDARAIHITISPPWWQTWWAYLSYVAAFFGLLFGVRRVELSRKLKNAEIKESQLRAQAAEAQAKVIQIENERKSKELEEARQLQLSMLPRQLPELPNLDIAVYMRTATEVGGDYYDFHVGLDGSLTVVIGDATGHGMKAGTIVTASKSLFSTHAANPDILFTFKEMTRCLKKMDLHLMSMCMTIMKIHQNQLSLSSAGMPPALLHRSGNGKVEELLVKGMPLGTFDDFPYEMKDTTLNPGDTILLMSDGLPELFNADKEMFGYERISEIFAEHAGHSAEDIIRELTQAGSKWVNEEDPQDDVTFVVLRLK